MPRSGRHMIKEHRIWGFEFYIWNIYQQDVQHEIWTIICLEWNDVARSSSAAVIKLSSLNDAATFYSNFCHLMNYASSLNLDQADNISWSGLKLYF